MNICVVIRLDGNYYQRENQTTEQSAILPAKQPSS